MPRGAEAPGLVKSQDVWMGRFGEVKTIKTGCSRIQDITIGKNFREYLVQFLNFPTEETEIESKLVFYN